KLFSTRSTATGRFQFPGSPCKRGIYLLFFDALASDHLSMGVQHSVPELLRPQVFEQEECRGAILLNDITDLLYIIFSQECGCVPCERGKCACRIFLKVTEFHHADVALFI